MTPDFPIVPPDVLASRAQHGDLTGITFGRFTVIGLSSELPGRWVVKCGCGGFETRRAAAIKNPNNSHDSCRACMAAPKDAIRAARQADDRPLAKTCNGKMIFTKREAETARNRRLKSRRRGGHPGFLRIYPCPECNFWRLTRKP